MSYLTNHNKKYQYKGMTTKGLIVGILIVLLLGLTSWIIVNRPGYPVKNGAYLFEPPEVATPAATLSSPVKQTTGNPVPPSATIK